MTPTDAQGSDILELWAVSDLPAMWLEAGDVERIRSAMGRGVYPPDAVVAMRELLFGIHELCIEIDRSHEREADQGARLATAEAVVVAYKAIHGEYTTYLEKSSDYRHLRRTLEAAVTAYDTLVGTGGGADGLPE